MFCLVFTHGSLNHKDPKNVSCLFFTRDLPNNKDLKNVSCLFFTHGLLNHKDPKNVLSCLYTWLTEPQRPEESKKTELASYVSLGFVGSQRLSESDSFLFWLISCMSDRTEIGSTFLFLFVFTWTLKWVNPCLHFFVQVRVRGLQMSIQLTLMS